MTALALQKPELVDKLEQLSFDYDIPLENLLNRAVQEFVERMERQIDSTRHRHPNVSKAFMQEIDAFEHLKPKLIEEYEGRTVAIYQGEVVAVGDDILGVHDSVIEQYGEVPCYVELVKSDAPRKVRMPSFRVKR